MSITPNYPGSLDDTSSLPIKNGTDSPQDHAELHNAETQILRTLESKLGIQSSTPGTAGQILISTGGGGSSWQPMPAPTGNAGGDLTGQYPNPSLAGVPGVAGSYTNANVTVDSKGRVVTISSGTGGGGGGGSSPLTTKGDLYGHNATVDARIPVGVDGRVLTADSSAATGVSWQTPTGGVTSVFGRTGAVVAASGDYSAAQITGLGSLATKNTVTLTTDVTGVLPIANGGSGQSTQQTALDALAGAVTAASFLRGNGTHVVMAPLQSGDLPAIAESQVTGLVADLALKAPLASPALTGNPTAPTQAAGDISTKLATTAFVATLGSTSLVQGETPGGSVNGSNTAYTTASVFATGSLRVYLNGQRLTAGSGNDYVETTQGFTMQYAPATGDVMLIDYNITNTAFVIGSNSIIVQETPTGSVNGSNTSFTVLQSKYVANTLEVFLNGVEQTRGVDYTETTPGSGIFTFTAAPFTGDIVRVSYQFSTGASGNADTVDGIHANATPTANTILPLDSSAFLLTAALRIAGAQTNTIVTDQSTTATSYADLATVGPQVTVTIGPSGMAIAIWEAGIYNVAAVKLMGLALSGANVQAASSTDCIRNDVGPAFQTTQSFFMLYTGLTPGSTTFTNKYSTASGTANFFNRRLIVIPL